MLLGQQLGSKFVGIRTSIWLTFSFNASRLQIFNLTINKSSGNQVVHIFKFNNKTAVNLLRSSSAYRREHINLQIGIYTQQFVFDVQCCYELVRIVNFQQQISYI